MVKTMQIIITTSECENDTSPSWRIHWADMWSHWVVLKNQGAKGHLMGWLSHVSNCQSTVWIIPLNTDWVPRKHQLPSKNKPHIKNRGASQKHLSTGIFNLLDSTKVRIIFRVCGNDCDPYLIPFIARFWEGGSARKLYSSLDCSRLSQQIATFY